MYAETIGCNLHGHLARPLVCLLNIGWQSSASCCLVHHWCNPNRSCEKAPYKIKKCIKTTHAHCKNVSSAIPPQAIIHKVSRTHSPVPSLGAHHSPLRFLTRNLQSKSFITSAVIQCLPAQVWRDHRFPINLQPNSPTHSESQQHHCCTHQLPHTHPLLG